MNPFDDPRIAGVYDTFDSDRTDLDAYLAIVSELGASRVLDLGCGTGTLAIMLASSGLDVVALDPARAMLDVARAKPGPSTCDGSVATPRRRRFVRASTL